jgi:KDO2-lipid IV(A) lauroyltransferase
MVTLFRLLSLFPLRFLHGLGALFGWLVYGLSPAYRRRLRANLRQAGLDTPLTRRATVAAIGRGMLELPYIWMRPSGVALSRVKVENWSAMQSGLHRGKGVILIVPHLGCFELVGQYCASRLPVFTALYRPHRKAALAPLVEQARGKHLDLASADMKGVRKLLKVLRSGQAIGMLPDQVPSQGDGVWADFFGKPAYSMTLPVRLAQTTGAAIVLAYCQRLSRGRYCMRFLPFEEPLAQDLQAATVQLNRAMENVIRQCPEQYLWSYNRYKTPVGSTGGT